MLCRSFSSSAYPAFLANYPLFATCAPANNPMNLEHEISRNLEAAQGYSRRVFHGRGKAFIGAEHLNIEWYPPYLLVQNFGAALDSSTLESLERIFQNLTEIEAVLVQARVWPELVTEVLYKRQTSTLPISKWSALSEDVECEVVLGKNRNTGVFLDMRAGWQWVQQHARDKKVLNLFCYTGIFSLFALAGGATKVDNVDMAANVLKIAQRNHQRNNLHDAKLAFFKRDILKSARWFENREPYDVIIIDPPPYQKKAFRGWHDYLKLLDYCQHCIAPNGTLFACLNNPQVSIEDFRHDLQQRFPQARSITAIATAEEIKEQDEQRGLKTVAIQF